MPIDPTSQPALPAQAATTLPATALPATALLKAAAAGGAAPSAPAPSFGAELLGAIQALPAAGEGGSPLPGTGAAPPSPAPAATGTIGWTGPQIAALTTDLTPPTAAVADQLLPLVPGGPPQPARAEVQPAPAKPRPARKDAAESPVPADPSPVVATPDPANAAPMVSPPPPPPMPLPPATSLPATVTATATAPAGAPQSPTIHAAAHEAAPPRTRNSADATPLPEATAAPPPPAPRDGPPALSIIPSLTASTASPTASGATAPPAAPTSSIASSAPAPESRPELTYQPPAHPGAPERLTLKLTPAELGAVTFEIRSSADGPRQIHVLIDRAETLTLFQQDHQHLASALSRAGLEGGDTQVTVSLASDRAPPPDTQGGGLPSQGQSAAGFSASGQGGGGAERQAQPGRGPGTDFAAPPGADAETAPPGRAPLAYAMLDIFA